MPRYSYGLGLSLATLTNLESLATPIYPPRGRFYEASVFLDRADGHVAAHGFPYTIWLFNTLTVAMIAHLRLFCPGQSAEVYISTRNSADAFAIYRGVMIWPSKDQMDKRLRANFYEDLEFTFRRLEPVLVQLDFANFHNSGYLALF